MAWSPKDPPRYGGLKIDGVPPFQGSIEFTFDPKVNVFIGPNATGKSTILKVLYPEFRELYDLQHLDLGRVGLDLRLPKLDQPTPQGEWSVLFSGDWLEHDKVPYSDKPHPLRGEVNPGTVPLIYLPPIREVGPPFVADYDSDHLRPENRHKTFDDRVGDLVVWEFGEEYVDSTHKSSTLEARLAWLEKIHASWGINWDQDAFLGQDKRIEKIRSGDLADLALDASPFTSFDCNRVPYALERLRADDKSREGSGLDNGRVRKVAYACVRDICPEVIQGESASIYTPKPLVDSWTFETLDGSDLPIESAVEFVERPGMAAETRDSESPLYWGDLSTGTQGLWWWICYLALKMAWHYLFFANRWADEGWQHLPAILLIDEIENHLHPTWQRRVIPALRKHFPGLQIFATTHSPFVVAGLKRGQVHRLYREKGVIKTDQLTEEEKERKLVSWTVEQILRKFMDVTDPTDEATATAAATLRWLQGRQPPPDVKPDVWVQDCIQHLRDNHERDENETAALVWLTERQQKEGDKAAIDAVELTEQQKEGDKAPKDAVEWRAWVLEELRTLVSLDIEAGGPFAAQRERFTAQLRKLLAKDQTGSQDPEEEG